MPLVNYIEHYLIHSDVLCEFKNGNLGANDKLWSSINILVALWCNWALYFRGLFYLDTRQRLLHKITKTKFPHITNRRTVLNFDDIKYITINGKVAREGKHDQHLSHQCVVCLIDHQDKILELSEWSSLDGIYMWNTTDQKYLVDSKILKSSINFAKFIAKITNVELIQYPISGENLLLQTADPHLNH